MCGIFGYNQNNVSLGTVFFDAMRHRGPDAQAIQRVGSWFFGHLRLSIIDTSSAANQPFRKGDDIIVFNGEIYNYIELREQYLSGVILETTSDTEVLLELLRLYGLTILNKLNGMFAFAWYNIDKNETILARDRFGVKPLHWMDHEGHFFFASEMRPLIKIKKHFKFNNAILESFKNDTATDFDEQTFAEGIFQIPAGHYMVIDGNYHQGVTSWYHGNDFVFDKSMFVDYKSTVDYFEDLLTDAINIRHRSDVSVAITLSGGLDSTVIYTLAKERLNSKIKPFTFVHPGSPTNEFEKVSRLARDYGDQVMTVQDELTRSLEDLNEALYFLEFPIWSPSGIAYLNMYRALKNNGYKVVIEGHGSDEQLGGYPYLITVALRQELLNGNFLRAWKINRVLQETTSEFLDSKSNTYLRKSKIISRLRLFASSALAAVRHKNDPHRAQFQVALDESFNYKILPIVLRTFDRLTMSQSVESRCPFMDYRVVEFIRAMPTQFKVNEIGSKAILREILKKYKKDYIYSDKKKMGFASDVPRFLDNAKVKETFATAIAASHFPHFEEIKREALAKIQQPGFSWTDSESIWKVASLQMTKELYEHY